MQISVSHAFHFRWLLLSMTICLSGLLMPTTFCCSRQRDPVSALMNKALCSFCSENQHPSFASL